MSRRLQKFEPPSDLLFDYKRYTVNDLKNLRVLDGRVDFQTVLAAGKNPGSQHHVQVPGGIRLFFPDRWENFADATLPLAKKIYDLHAGGLSQGFQNVGAEWKSVRWEMTTGEVGSQIEKC
jgi:hypothetical protein